MNDEDYFDLIALVKQEMSEVGFADLASDQNYTKRFLEGEFAEERLPPAKEHLIQLLSAFKTQMKLEHKGTIAGALARISDHVGNEKPKRAIFEQSPREGSERTVTFDMANRVHDHSKLLMQLENLLVRLAEYDSRELD